ncbi:hypothetical protein K1719_044173 [Acacia pycnantha]|nr:hypothetical protein K1719_044173 [Acacia pycnantha]
MQVREIEKAFWIDSLAVARIIGSCNGLLCIEIRQYKELPPSLLVWNPATKEIRHLPRSTIDCFDYHDRCVTGFGFSSIGNNYKIVRTWAKLYDATNRVEVFSLSRGSWKEIDIGNLKGVKLYPETVTSNGGIFWFGTKLGVKEGNYDGEVIVSFDIAKEVFTLMPKPNLDCFPHESLTVYENKLAILGEIDGDDDESSDLIGLWVMEEEKGKAKKGDSRVRQDIRNEVEVEVQAKGRSYNRRAGEWKKKEQGKCQKKENSGEILMLTMEDAADSELRIVTEEYKLKKTDRAGMLDPNASHLITTSFPHDSGRSNGKRMDFRTRRMGTKGPAQWKTRLSESMITFQEVTGIENSSIMADGLVSEPKPSVSQGQLLRPLLQ